MAIDTTPFPDVLPPELKRNRDWTWWINDTMIRTDVKIQLDTIKNNFRPHAICHVEINNGSHNCGFLFFKNDSLMLNADTYLNYPSEWERLLMFFKYWNIIRYFNPYNYVLDSSWDSTLFYFSVSLANAPDHSTLAKTIFQVASRLDDAHVEGLTTDNYLWIPPGFTPSIRVKYIQNKYIVVKSAYSAISKGDEIVSVDGTTINQIENNIMPYISAGNLSVLHRSMCNFLLGGLTYNGLANIVYKDSLGNNQAINLARSDYPGSNFFTDWYPNDTLKNTKWKKWNCNVGYINMKNLQSTDLSSMYTNLQNTSALIIDQRNYPQVGAYNLASLLYASPKVWSKFLEPDTAYPGTYYWDSISWGGSATPYTGQIILLHNEDTQSAAEFNCMALDAMPNCIKVGSQTAGADGNISYFKLSKDLLTGFTSIGVFYPNGDSTQRIGIVPDSIVYPTQIGIRWGKDEILEKALEIANCTGLNENTSTDISLKVYPNPSDAIINVEINNSNFESAEIVLTNTLGQLIKRNTVPPARLCKIQVDLSSYSPGIYLLTLKSSRKITAQRIIKSR